MKDMKFKTKFFCKFKKRNYSTLKLRMKLQMEIADDLRSDHLTLFIDIGHKNSLS